jgi:hypothetical protein
VVLSVLGLGAILAIVVVVRYLPAINALAQGRDDVLAAEAVLRTGGVNLQPDQAAVATRLLTEASTDFGERSSVIADGWFAGLLSHLPVLDLNVATVRDLRQAGSSGVDLALALIPLLEDLHSTATLGGSGVIGRLSTLAGAHDADLTRALGDVNKLSDAISSIPGGWLFGPVDHMRSVAQQAMTRVVAPARGAISIMRSLPLVTGTGLHRYLLLLTNPGEERGGGGFIGAVGTVAFQDGNLAGTSFLSSDFSDALVTDIPPPEPIGAITGTNLALADSDWSPDFPTSAALAEDFYIRATGESLDGVINVDPVALSYVMGAIGSVHVPPYPQVVTANNALVELNYIINKARPGDPGKVYLAPFGQAVLNALFKAKASQWPALAGALERGVKEKHIVLFFKNKQLQNLVRSGDAGGIRPNSAGDSLLVADSNLSGTKGDLFVTRRFALNAAVDGKGHVQDRLTLSYQNPVVTSAADAALLVDSDGRYEDYIRVYLPSSANFDDLLVIHDGSTATSVSPEDFGIEGGRQWIAYRLIMNPGTTASITFLYDGPFAQTKDGSSVTYSLDWEKQINALTWPATVEVRLADGRSAHWQANLGADQHWQLS